jgi:hypothetical protein
LLQNSLSPRRKFHVHFAPVFVAPGSLNESSLGQPVHELNCAVVLELEALSEIRDVGARRFTSPLHGKHQLMVLRLQTCFAGHFLAEAQETADLVAKLG